MIVIPMAGLSRRFAEAGYTQPKYRLEAHGASLFDHAVRSFATYFDTLPFLFIARDVAETAAFVTARCEALGVRRHQIVMLDHPTRGQADTVAIGLDRTAADPAAPLTIFNIDTFRPGFRFPDRAEPVDGFLETFVGEGTGWSFVRAAAPGSDRVTETTEKRRISDHCCTGLYHFARAGDFRRAFETESQRSLAELDGGELYVAPLYNHLIAAGQDIRFTTIAPNEVIFCGVPAEYEAFLAREV
jgi:hypothetical protein